MQHLASWCRRRLSTIFPIVLFFPRFLKSYKSNSIASIGKWDLISKRIFESLLSIQELHQLTTSNPIKLQSKISKNINSSMLRNSFHSFIFDTSALNHEERRENMSYIYKLRFKLRQVMHLYTYSVR